MKAVAAMLLLASLAFAQPPKQGEVTMNVFLTGADSVPPQIKRAIQKEIGHTFSGRDEVPGKIDEMAELIRDQFQQYGYFKAALSEAHGKERYNKGVLKETDLTFKISEGGRYRVGDIRITNAQAFDPATLRKLIPMQPGEIFNVEQLRQGLKAIRELYCTEGYINLIPVPNMDVDDGRLLINTNFDMDEGPQFRFGRLTLEGLEPHPGAGKKLLDAAMRYEGQVYQCGMDEKIFESGTSGRKQEFEHALYSGRWESSVNNDSHTVDFHYEFPDSK